MVTPDLGGPREPIECDVFAQACEAGEKCAPVIEHGDWFDATRCVPVLGDGIAGEPCKAEGGGTKGLDDCALGLLCWNVDMRGEGTCLPLCAGNWQSPVCPEDFACTLLADDSTLWLCLAQCDPLMQGCLEGETCAPFWKFVCLPDTSGDGGQANDACVFPGDCDPGLACISSVVASAVCEPSTCCSPFCQLPDGACPNADQECVAWYAQGEAPAGEEDIGICQIP